MGKVARLPPVKAGGSFIPLADRPQSGAHSPSSIAGTLMVEKTTSPWASWELCPPDTARQALARTTEEIPAYFTGTTLKVAKWTALPFYRKYRLIEAEIESNG